MSRPDIGRRRVPKRIGVRLPDPVETRITGIGADGDGTGVHPDGSRLYVPLTVPGDFVRVRPVARRGEGWAADVESVLEHGGGRREAACVHFGVCGGCTSQHWDAAAYLAWKTDRLGAALRRAGFEDPVIVPILPGAPGARRRMDFALLRVAAGIVAGLHRARGTEVIDVLDCPVLHPALFRLIAPLRVMLAGLSALRHEGSLVANLLDSGPDLLLRTDGALTTADRAIITAFARSQGLPRVSWALGDERPEAVCVLHPPVTSLSGVSITPPAGAFLQATSEGEAAIVAAVMEGLPAKQTARARVLELFAGCGTISFALAQRIKVTAVEGDEALVAACHHGINQAGLMGKIEVRRRDLARQPFLANELAGFSAVVLDPPHAGAAVQIPYIAQAKVPTVIYVSCDPVSLGRDAAVLRGAGYRLEKVTPIDQFLWSARLEAVAVFRLGK
jgi:23S rRNA (uracil1939-C5)-methyltransferase